MVAVLLVQLMVAMRLVAHWLALLAVVPGVETQQLPEQETVAGTAVEI